MRGGAFVRTEPGVAPDCSHGAQRPSHIALVRVCAARAFMTRISPS